MQKEKVLRKCFVSILLDLTLHRTGQDLYKWCTEEVEGLSFENFDFNVKKLAGKIKGELDSFYSTDLMPKSTGKMTTTERHYLSGCIAKDYPLLAFRYQEFKE